MAVNKVTLLQEAILSLTKEINKNGTATNKQTKELELLRQQYEKVNKLMPQYRKKHKEINEELKKAEKLTQKATKTTKGFGSRVSGAIKTLAAYGVAYKLINGATRLFTELTVGSVKQAREFQSAIANLSAVAGVSGENLKRLGDNALDVANSTKFTAIEIVGLQTELSKLGFGAEDVINATEAIAFAAQGLGAPLAAVASQVGKVINQFGLLTEETTYVTDVLLTTVNESALSFESFGTAIQYVGPIARNLGLTFEQTAGAMAVLSDNGFTASRVGTGLRGIFTELGKTSADVEASLKSLAEQNISLSEAVDLVGKRNASQLLTLLDNIDAIDENNNKYYEAGRAYESAAKQIDTFDGQLGILTSNFRQLQIEIGNSVVESDLLVRALDILFKEAANTARGFQAINEIGFDEFSSGADAVSKGADAQTTALKKLGVSYEEYQEAVDEFNKMAKSPFISFLKGIDDYKQAEKQFKANQLISKVTGLREAMEGEVDVRLIRAASLKGEEAANKLYADSVKELTDAHRQGNNVNDEVDELYAEISKSVKFYNKLIGDGTKITYRSRIEYEKTVQTLQRLQEQLKNASMSTEELAEKKEKKEKKAVKEAIKAIQRETKERVNALNERAKVETAVAESAEEKADIEAERTRLVSNEYKKQSAQIRDLADAYTTQKDAIELAAESSDKLAAILTSEVFEDADAALKDYGKTLKDLKKKFKDGEIGQKQYNRAVKDAKQGLIANINAFKELVDESPEVLEFFDNLLEKFDKLTEITEKYTVKDAIAEIKESTKETIALIEEQAKIDTAIAESAEEKAKIEAKRTEDVSKAYEKQTQLIRGLKFEFEASAKEIEKAAKESEELADVLTSDVFSDAQDSFEEISDKLKEYKDQLKDGKITQKEYESKVANLRIELGRIISTFDGLVQSGPKTDKFFQNLLDNFDKLSDATEITDEEAKKAREELEEDIKELINLGVDAFANSFSEFNDVALENTKNRLQSELEEVKNRYKIEEDILKSSLDNQIITENQYRAKQKELQKAQIAEENALNKKIFEAEKKQDRNNAIIDGTAAAAQAFVNAYKIGEPITASVKAILSASIIASQTLAQVAAINSRKFFPVKYESGGVVNGPSHSSGGVPFTVQGQGGYEMEGGEFIVNKKATAMHKDLLERINGSEKTNPRIGKTYFQTGGLVSAVNNESVNYLKAIAEATTSTAISSSKPVRAFISSKDLRSNENERRLRDRNDRI